MRRTPKHTHERGQVLVLFVGGMFGLLALAALAIDLSSVYSTQQTERAAADAAVLAGAQQLGLVGTQSTGVKGQARHLALEDLAGRFGVAVPTSCGELTGDVTDCQLGTGNYRVAISTPSKTTGNPQSVQVSVFNPNFQLSFARLLGQNGWNVGRTSVAVNDRAPNYALLTLRPSQSGTDVDITIGGTGSTNTSVTVTNGDVGINGNMNYNGTNSRLTLESGFDLRYYAPNNNAPQWGANPPGMKLTTLIPDPHYTIPVETDSTPKGTEDKSGCKTIADSLVLPGSGYQPYVPLDKKKGGPDMTSISCFTPGVWSSSPPVPNGGLAILEPGLYFLDGGLNVKGTIIGGYTPNSEGVALVFPEGTSTTTGLEVTGSNNNILLNAGAKLNTPAGAEASAALDFQTPTAQPVQTNGTPPIPMTLIVTKDTRCLGEPGDIIKVPLPLACTPQVEGKNSAIDLTGTGALYLAGVQYAVTDNIKVAGGSNGTGYVGQLVAWTVDYKGNSTITQEGTGVQANGILRLDTACSGGDTSCSP
jgi:Putative Flp pilus-assembly TadE/G-like